MHLLEEVLWITDHGFQNSTEKYFKRFDSIGTQVIRRHVQSTHFFIIVWYFQSFQWLIETAAWFYFQRHSKWHRIKLPAVVQNSGSVKNSILSFPASIAPLAPSVEKNAPSAAFKCLYFNLQVHFLMRSAKLKFSRWPRRKQKLFDGVSTTVGAWNNDRRARQKRSALAGSR